MASSVPNDNPSDRDALEQQFEEDMYRGIETLRELGYPASQFKIMVKRDGAVATARRLVLEKTPSYGL